MSRQVVALRPIIEAPLARSPMHTALDDLEQGAAESGVLYADVVLQLALARHLVDVVAATEPGSELTVAQAHAIRELRLTITGLRELVVGYDGRR